MKTTRTVLLAFVIAVTGGCIGAYLGLTYPRNHTAPIQANATRPATASATDAPAIGKFQIVPGEYVFDSGKAQTITRGTFRINTETGEASLYEYFTDANGKLQMFWNQIDESMRH